MIGYNIKKINDLLADIADSYEKIGKAMKDGWNSVDRTLGQNWIGEDEVAYTGELAKRICELYANCKETVHTVASSIKGLGDSWKAFQKQNVIDGATADEIVGDIEMPAFTDAGIEDTVKKPNRSFDANTNRGIKDEHAGTECFDAVTTYVTEVKGKVANLYDKLDTEKAFLGTEQSGRIKTYLTEMGKSIADLTTCVKTLRSHIETLTANVAKQESTTVESISSASTSIDGIESEKID